MVFNNLKERGGEICYKKVLFCTLLIILFSYSALARTTDDAPKYEEGAVLVGLHAPEYEESVGMDVYSQLLLAQAEAFASKYDLKVISTYPAMTRSTEKNIIYLRSENKSIDELIKEFSSES